MLAPRLATSRTPNKKGSLIPDPETAYIVQDIFMLASKGKSARAIADILTKRGYITPLKYRVLHRGNFSEKGAERATDIWNHTTVKRILKNQVYLGHTILGKTKKMNFKSKKKIALPQEEWAITLNTHTPLVTQEQFNMAERFMGMNTKRWKDCEQCRVSVFSGVVFCANCGLAMCSAGTVYKGEREKYWYLSCQNSSSRSVNHCEHGARIKYSDLCEIIKQELNSLVSLNDKKVKALVENAVNSSGKTCYSNRSTKSIEKKLKTIENMMMKLYEDNVKGIIDDDRLDSMITALGAQAKALNEQLASVQNENEMNGKMQNAYQDFFNLVKKYTQFDELTPEIVRTFIERIEIGEKILPEGYKVATHNIPFKQEIKIQYRFSGEMNVKEIHYENPVKTA